MDERLRSLCWFETSFFEMELRLAGFFLLLSGWILMLAAIFLLSALPPRTAFAAAGFAVEVLGLVLVARSHIPKRKKHDA